MACCAVLAASTPGNGAGTGGCESFAWSIETERALLTAADSLNVPSVANLGAIPEKAIAVQMAPAAGVTYLIPPNGKPKSDTANAFGAVLQFGGAAESGLYQVTLSDKAWIDVIQKGAALEAVAHTGKSDCASVRKSVRFNIDAGPFAVQLSGAANSEIKLSIRRAK